MKFGKDLLDNRVAKWECEYIDYERCKVMVKQITGFVKPERKDGRPSPPPPPEAANEAPATEESLFLFLDSELAKVNRFYLSAVTDHENRLGEISLVLQGGNMSIDGRRSREGSFDGTQRAAQPDAASSSSASSSSAKAGDSAVEAVRPGKAKAVMSPANLELELIEIYCSLGQLQSYVWLNTKGFSKIVKKYDKYQGWRGTHKQLAPKFEHRLSLEPFRSVRLDNCLETYRLAREKLKGGSEMTLKLLAGTANPPLAEEVAARLGVPLTEAKIGRFKDGEVNIQIMENVRNADVFILQPTCMPVNDNLMELLLLISACRRASATRVTAVVPYYGYARQDRKERSRVPISAADVARLIETMGVDRVVCVDLHCGQIQGFFGPKTPVDNLYASPIALSFFNMKNLHTPVVISPDAGGVARAKMFLEGLMAQKDGPEDASLAVIIKSRPRPGVIGSMHLVGSVEGCDCIIVDDMIDTAGTLCSAANELKNFGARRIFCFASHGLFNGPAADRIERSALEEVVVANTIFLRPEVIKETQKIRQLSVGKLLEGAIRAIHSGSSISELFHVDMGGKLLA